jgi:hypothetical protein
MAVHRRYDIWAILVIVLAIVAYASFRTEFRLRASVPVEFFDPSGLTPKKRAAEEVIAKAYWECAITQIQWKYGYAHRLPDDPPPEFSVTTMQAGSAADDTTVRNHYWQRLRATWVVSSAWEEHYDWNTISLSNALRSAGAWLEGHMRAILGYS